MRSDGGQHPTRPAREPRTPRPPRTVSGGRRAGGPPRRRGPAPRAPAPRLDLPVMNSEPVVQVVGLVKRYGPKTAVDGLDLTVGAGAVTAVLGPNGAGKTTTIETCEGYRRPDAGTVRVLGLDPVADAARLKPRDRRHAPVRRRLLRRPRRRDAAPHGQAARPPARRGRAHRAPRPRRLRPHHLPQALRRPAAAPRARDGRRRPPRTRLPRRADRRASTHRPAAPPGTSCASCAPTASRWCSPPTSWTRPRRWPTTWPSSTRAGSSPRAPPSELCKGGAENTLRFTGRPGLDLGSLLKALPDGSAAAELTPGAYRIDGAIDPQLLATVTSWCAQHGVMPDGISVERHTLEDVFLELTGKELRA